MRCTSAEATAEELERKAISSGETKTSSTRSITARSRSQEPEESQDPEQNRIVQLQMIRYSEARKSFEAP